MHNSEFFKQLLILIGSTTFVATVFHYFRLPTIVGFIVSGIVIGPYATGLISSIPGAELLSEIGVLFLMFTIGLEFSLSKLKTLMRPFLGLGAAQVIGTVLITGAIFRYGVGLSPSKSIFFGFLMSLSSTAIVVKLLQDARDTASPYATAAFGVLLFQDIAVIPMMLVTPLLAKGTLGFSSLDPQIMGLWIAKISVIAGLMFLTGRVVIPFVLERIVKTKSHELFFFSMLFFCFGTSFVLQSIGLSLSLGAFFAGVMIAESAYGRQATADILPMRDCFLGLFFASVGMLVDPTFVLAKLHWILLIVLAVLIFKSGLIYVMARLLRYAPSTAAIAALSVFQLGEFSFILADLGKTHKLLAEAELQMFLSVSVITMMLTPLVFRWAPRVAFSRGFEMLSRVDLFNVPRDIHKLVSQSVQKERAVNATADKPDNLSGHTIIIGFGVAGQNLAEGLRKLEIPYSIIEQNFELVQKHQAIHEHLHFGDASRWEILEHAGLDSAKLVVIAASGVHMTGAVVKSVRKARPDIPLLIRTQYAREALEFADLEHADVVVAEFETTIELVARALSAYGVAAEEIHSHMAKTRDLLRGEKSSWSDFLRTNMDLPSWKELGSVRPMIIRPHYSCVGKKIAEIGLRQVSNVTIVAVVREGMGYPMPTADFTIVSGDIVHILGADEALDAARAVLVGSDDAGPFSLHR